MQISTAEVRLYTQGIRCDSAAIYLGAYCGGYREQRDEQNKVMGHFSAGFRKSKEILSGAVSYFRVLAH